MCCSKHVQLLLLFKHFEPKIFGSLKNISRNLFDFVSSTKLFHGGGGANMPEENYWTKLSDDKYWTTLSDTQRDMMGVLLPFSLLIGALGYLVCIHLHNDNQTCPIISLFYKKSTPAPTVSVTMFQMDFEEDWKIGLVGSIVIILAILMGFCIKWIVGYIRKRRLNRTILDINTEGDWEYAFSPKAEKIKEAESTLIPNAERIEAETISGSKTEKSDEAESTSSPSNAEDDKSTS